MTTDDERRIEEIRARAAAATPESDMGLYLEGAAGWGARTIFLSDAGRELLRITPDNEVTIADDLTMDEARELIEGLARKCVEIRP